MFYNYSKPILIPSNISLKIIGNQLVIKDKKNVIITNISNYIQLYIKNGLIFINICNDSNNENKNKNLIKTYRTIICNAIIGATSGFQQKLLLVGVGYKVVYEQNFLIFNVGFSHVVKYKIPQTVVVSILNFSTLLVTSVNKILLGIVSREIQNIKKPDSYKGKGIRIFSEKIKLKEVKKK